MGKKARSSNIELYRIVMMLIIIAHHLVVNSGITANYNFKDVTDNMWFLMLFGFGGKPMIDGFLLITGFFTIKGKFTFEKALKVLFEIVFYKVGFYLLFAFLGFHDPSWRGLHDTFLYVFRSAHTAFPATYFWLYCLTPFINKMVEGLEKRQYLTLIGVLITYYTVISTVFEKIDTFSELGWYITVYLIGGYLRLYEPRVWNKAWKSGIWTLGALAACFVSIAWMVWQHMTGPCNLSIYYYVANAHKPLGLLLAVCSFQLFRHLKMPNSRVINTLASSIFGVLLIHGNSDLMRKKLWVDWLRIPELYDWKWLPLYAVGCVFAIFVVCTAIDQVRIHLIENPVFRVYRWLENTLRERFCKKDTEQPVEVQSVQ